MTTTTRTEELALITELKQLAETEIVKENGTVHKKIENGIITNNNTGPYTVDTKGKLPSEIGTDYNFKRKIVWFNAIGFLFLHFLALIGVYLCFKCNILTVVWMFVVAYASGQGITMGAHRLWAHKTFKANFLLRLTLILFQTVAGQNCLYIWARDHRLHHKYSDTDADPHNSKRGFFFSHIGWLMSRKHPAVISKGKTIDLSDLHADPLVMYQMKYYNALYLIFAISIPVAVPVWLWNESYINSFFISYMLRYIITLHITWLVNSAAHMFGTKPFDKNMQPVESWLVSFLSTGEGWHNYHHAFPWDYRASEYGAKFNFTTVLIDFLAYIGLAYDLRSAPEHMVKHRALKAGDGSHPLYGPMKMEIEQTKENEDTKPEEIKQNGIDVKQDLSTTIDEIFSSNFIDEDQTNIEEKPDESILKYTENNNIKPKTELIKNDKFITKGKMVNGDAIIKRNIKHKVNITSF